MLSEWPRTILDEASIEGQFQFDRNLGVLQGAQSGGLADVDIDDQIAIGLAPKFLPLPIGVFGRTSNLRSHWIYCVEPADFPTIQFKDPRDGSTLVELRGSGSQTMFPPSVHPSGEKVQWEKQPDTDAARVSYELLKQSVAKLAAATLLAKCWPSRGSRHNASLAIAGALLRRGWKEQEA